MFLILSFSRLLGLVISTFGLSLEVSWNLCSHGETEQVWVEADSEIEETNQGVIQKSCGDFISNLHKESIWPVKKVNAFHENKCKNPEYTYPGKEKRIKSVTLKVRRDGTPWINKASYMEMKQEAKGKKQRIAAPRETSASFQTVNDNFNLQNFNRSFDDNELVQTFLP